MKTADFDYELPEALIAQEALDRGRSRLLALPSAGEIRDLEISQLAELLKPGDLLVVNDTRVLAARLLGRRPGGGRAELLLVAPRDPEEAVEDAVEWICLARPRKRLKPGTEITFDGELSALVLDHLPPDRLTARFSRAPAGSLDRIGHVPLPPYINRADTAADAERYQTVFADAPGAVAAPTAGLHFDDRLLKTLRLAGVGITAITLHVGPGTFRPVSAADIDRHTMESERFRISSKAAGEIAAARARGGAIVAVGTTVVRTLEAAALLGDGRIEAQSGAADLFIKPGFEFRVVDRLLTNFHLPRSTLLMLVSAFAGRQRVLAAYRHAIERGYRFYSYGDAMFLDRNSAAATIAAPRG